MAYFTPGTPEYEAAAKSEREERIRRGTPRPGDLEPEAGTVSNSDARAADLLLRANAGKRKPINIDYRKSNLDAGMALESRNAQGSEIDRLRAMSEGRGYSAGQNLLGQYIGDARAAAESNAASARGSLGQALAARRANLAGTDAAVRLGGQRSALGAQEQAAAMAQLQQALAAQRMQDMQARAASGAEAQAQGALANAQAGRNDTYELGMNQLGNSVQEGALARGHSTDLTYANIAAQDHASSEAERRAQAARDAAFAAQLTQMAAGIGTAALMA